MVGIRTVPPRFPWVETARPGRVTVRGWLRSVGMVRIAAQTCEGRTPHRVRNTVRSVGETPLAVRSDRCSVFLDDVHVIGTAACLNAAASMPIAATQIVGPRVRVEGSDRRVLRHALTRLWIMRVVRPSDNPIGTAHALTRKARHGQNGQKDMSFHGEAACLGCLDGETPGSATSPPCLFADSILHRHAARFADFFAQDPWQAVPRASVMPVVPNNQVSSSSAGWCPGRTTVAIIRRRAAQPSARPSSRHRHICGPREAREVRCGWPARFPS